MAKGTLSDFVREPFSAGGVTHDIYRQGSGPAVVVMSEIPGITPRVAEFARKVAAIGCTAVMPHMFGDPGRGMTIGYTTASLAKVCISSEFTKLARKQSGTITTWLRALAK